MCCICQAPVDPRAETTRELDCWHLFRPVAPRRAPLPVVQGHHTTSIKVNSLLVGIHTIPSLCDAKRVIGKTF